MEKYQLINESGKPVNIFVDKDCVEEFLSMSGWSKDEFERYSTLIKIDLKTDGK